ncbi:hypothetical protein N7447_008261 [Penicillium robsamsonii]|uniref:uncharacterized protein n=1 Tax=Penicillium robsamsonii TaxID=1792511 RepID=UPI002547D2DD|nr:uncharacterized protein N7447_008261 [Penicillium robsamsonii]KAJ5816028.1 hypothetical protein N7447_008261 [Penicillium robsamsonii]
MLDYDELEQDLYDHLGYDSHDEIRWGHSTPSQSRSNPAALLAMQHASSGQTSFGSRPTSADTSPIMTAHFAIV